MPSPGMQPRLSAVAAIIAVQTGEPVVEDAALGVTKKGSDGLYGQGGRLGVVMQRNGSFLEQRRAMMLRRFDVNGNGVLDSDEREAMRAAFRLLGGDDGGMAHVSV